MPIRYLARLLSEESKKSEHFEALDNKKYELSAEDCVIADQSKVLGLGGIIGGVSTGTEMSTTDIVLEAASFDPVTIAKSSKRLGLLTDAKYRFERGVDPMSIEEGLVKASKLIQGNLWWKN